MLWRINQQKYVHDNKRLCNHLKMWGESGEAACVFSLKDWKGSRVVTVLSTAITPPNSLLDLCSQRRLSKKLINELCHKTKTKSHTTNHMSHHNTNHGDLNGQYSRFLFRGSSECSSFAQPKRGYGYATYLFDKTALTRPHLLQVLQLSNFSDH